MIALASKSWVKELLAGVLSKFGGGGANPTGTIINFMGKTAPNGYLACDGATYNITDYQGLANFIREQFGTVNYFGGDGAQTFAVPNLIDRFLKGENENKIGILEDAGLPNITGSFNHDWGTYNTNYKDKLGACTWGGTSNIYNSGSDGGGSRDGICNFDASQSNPIYGASDTVTPENISVLFCIKY